MAKDEKLNWKDIKLSKVYSPREVLDNQPYGDNCGKRWSFRPGEARAKSTFAVNRYLKGEDED